MVLQSKKREKHMATLKLKNINKIYPNGVQAVFDFNLDIRDKEFIVFVGPSGCGKSTTLRMIAGLEEISSGELYIDEELVNDKAPKDRNIAMVFQSYALYPHMTVYDNMAFGLKLRKMPKDVINDKVQEAAEILGLTPYLKRKPKALSGGQRQRVALGRAIVRNAKVFLMDEPLSNLDAKLRVQMRGELIKLHNKIETTTIYVTHDQIEAMTMASRIVVMKDGYIMQVGAPKEIYDNPNNLFVAGFIGTPPMNFIRGKVDSKGLFTAGDHKLQVPADKFEIVKTNQFQNKEIILGIRPEDIHDEAVVLETYPDAVLDIIVDVAELLGSETNLYTSVNGSNVCASINARAGVRIGDKMKLALDMHKCHFFDPESELRLVLNESSQPVVKKAPKKETEVKVEQA
jgi:multiple sugar transport system ATP-binding protein